MAATIALTYRKDKTDKKNQAPVYIRITKNRRTNYISTGIRIEEKYWDAKLNKIKPSYPSSERANVFLNKLLFEYQNKILKEQTTKTTINITELKRKITGHDEKDFFEISVKLAESYNERGSIGTYACANSVIQKVRNFAGTNSLGFSDITPKFLTDYEKYLRTQLKNKTNTVYKDMKFIRRVFNHAHKLGLIEYEIIPFNRYKLKTEKTERAYLTEEELNAFCGVELPEGGKLQRHKDIFTFCANCGGIRISDVLLLQKTFFNGTHINFTIQKTNKQIVIKVPDTSIAILKKYIEGSSKTNPFIFPEVPSNLNLDDPLAVDSAISQATARINKNLKTITKKAGINKKISTHSARHTWACLALRKGISIDKVSKIMGHSAIRETQIYAKLVSQDLDNAMDLFN